MFLGDFWRPIGRNVVAPPVRIWFTKEIYAFLAIFVIGTRDFIFFYFNIFPFSWHLVEILFFGSKTLFLAFLADILPF